MIKAVKLIARKELNYVAHFITVTLLFLFSFLMKAGRWGCSFNEERTEEDIKFDRLVKFGGSCCIEFIEFGALYVPLWAHCCDKLRPVAELEPQLKI